MSTPQQPLIPGRYYHVFNKSVGGEFLFKNHENYRYFMEKYQKYVSPFAETLAYCLMPTHFHFLIRPLGGDKTCGGFEAPDINREGRENQIPSKTCEGFETLAGLTDLSKNFSHLFNCYAQAYNKQNNRCGSLFKNRFKRVLITDEEHLRTAIVYIHLNPLHHHVVNKFTFWKYSSYNAIAGAGQTLVNREKVLNLFEGTENFIFCHQQKYEFNTGLYFD